MSDRWQGRPSARLGRQRVGAGAYVSAQQRTGPPSAGSMRV